MTAEVQQNYINSIEKIQIIFIVLIAMKIEKINIIINWF